MADETKLSEQILRGDEARAILENPLFKEAFQEAEKVIIEAWRNSPGDAKEVRDNAYLMQRLLVNLEDFLKRHINNGKAAQNDLLKLKEPSKIRRLING